MTGGASGVQTSDALPLPDSQAMIAMPFQRLIAVVLLIATTGCAATPLFSRKDDDDAPLDPRADHAQRLDEEDVASPLNGQWNVVRDADQTPEVAAPARPPVALPISELVGRAEQASAQQRLPEARQHCEAILRQQPSHPRAHHLLAYISDLEGRWGDAEHHYQLALQSDANNADIVGDLGYSYLLQGRLPLAEQYLLLARQLNPTNKNIAGNLAEVYSRRNDMQSAYRVLSEVLPPVEVEQTLARLFPGAPLHATMNQVPPALAANNPPFPGATPNSPQFTTASANPVGRQAPQNAVPGFMSAMPVVPPPANSSIPNTGVQVSTARTGQPGLRAPYETAPPVHAVPHAIEQASANGIAPPGSAATTAAPAARRWPPAFWPPEETEAPVTQASGVISATTSRSSSGGVTYLLPRRTQTPANAPVSPFPPLESQAANAVPSSAAQNPARSPAQEPLSRFDNPAQYANGPGASRIVTWSNMNGQSLESAPLPPTDDELRAAAAMGLNGGAPPAAAMRTSPGSASGWNGGFYPPPQRQLPGSTGSVYDYPQQGAPRIATAPGTAAAAAANEPHAGFVIAPPSALPSNPLAGFEAERRQFDQQLQQQVDQSYARSPSGFIRPPSEAIPVPTYDVSVNPQPALAGPPLTPNGTPWPGRAADGSVPAANAQNPATAAPETTPNGLVMPQPYRSTRTVAPAITPPSYNHPAPPVDSGTAYDGAGPLIRPGPSSW